MYGGDFAGRGFGFLWLVGTVLFFGLMFALVYVVVRHASRPHPPAGGPWVPPTVVTPAVAPPPIPPLTPVRAEPLDILRERFARGDISLDDFEAAKRALDYPSGPPTPPPGS